MALGEYPLVTLKGARERHFEARQRPWAAGIDPMAERKAEADWPDSGEAEGATA